jgi:Ca-activated chloride channel homolog
MRADFSLDYDVITVERSQKLYLMARFEAGSAPGDTIRRPLNLSLIIDRSGSMAGDKIDYTKQAAQFLVQHLGTRDRLSIVLYNDKVETLLLPEYVGNKDSITQLIERVRVRGTTNLSGGWLEGCKNVAQYLSDKTLNRVLLMSDGLANRGVTDEATLVTMATQKYEEGVSTTAMGLGKDFNEDLMMAMASAGGGAFYFIESPEVTPTIFQEELSGLLSVVGQNLMITVEQGQYVTGIRQLNAYPTDTDGKHTSFKLGDIFGNELKTLVLELSIPAMNTIGEEEIAVLRFEYDEIAGDTTTHHVKTLPVMVNVRPSAEPAPLLNPEVAESVLLLKAARARQQAVKLADRGDYHEAASLLQQVVDEIAKAQLDNEQLTEEKIALSAQADKLALGASAYDEYSRKTMSTQAFYTMINRHDDTVMLRRREKKRDQDGEGKDALQEAQQADGANKRRTMESIPAVRDEPSNVQRQPGVTPTHVTWKDQTFALTGDIIRLGRSSHNEIIINEKGVSRFHAHIQRNSDTLYLEDLGSTNGTRVNGKALENAHKHALSVGDIVYLCDEKLVFDKQT